MKELFRKIFSKNMDELKEGTFMEEGKNNVRFILRINNIEVGYLTVNNNEWVFEYSDEFRNQNIYETVPGFSDLNKVYRNQELWPFFKIRIPGLKQPMIKEIIEKEKLDIKNEIQLLKRFGRRIVSDPFVLDY